MSTRILCIAGPSVVSVLSALALIACGGQSQGECPPGFTCEPSCTGPTCGAPGTGPFDASTGGSMPLPPPETSDGAAPAFDGGASSSVYPDGSSLPASSALSPLAYDVVDAKLSVALSSLVIVSASPSNALHLYDVTTGADVSIALPSTPVAVAVDSTGLLAAVAYDAHVSWVDLQARAIKTTCDLSSDANDVALTTTGIAYVAPRTDQWVALHAIDLATCTETVESTIYAGATLGLHPSEQILFVTQDLDPTSILWCDLAATPVTCNDSEDLQNWGTYDFGNSVWPSADGSRLYTGGPATLLVGADGGAGVCTYGGSLPGVVGVQSLSEAPQIGRVALVPIDWDPEYEPSMTSTDTVVRVHETQYLALVAQYALPTASGQVEHGRFVFSTKAMDALYVIAQVEAADGGGGAFSVLSLVP